MNDLNIKFWRLTNAAGTAATVDSSFENQPVKINFYWSMAELAISPKSEQELSNEIHDFMIKHPLATPNGKNVFHIHNELGEFHETTDPGWVSPTQNS